MEDGTTLKTAISLTDRQAAFVRDFVKFRRYAATSAVLQRGFDILRQEEAQRDGLRALLEARRAGPVLTAEDWERDPEAMLARKTREYDL